MNDAAFSWRPGKLLHVFWVKKRYRYFEILLSKDSLSQNKYNLNLCFMMCSSSDEFTHLKENSTTDVSVGSSGHNVALKLKGHQHGVSLQSSINLGITLFRISRI